MAGRKGSKWSVRAACYVARDLIAQFGIDRVQDALLNEVQDAKHTEAIVINNGGPARQVEYLMEQAYYKERALMRIVAEYCEES